VTDRTDPPSADESSEGQRADRVVLSFRVPATTDGDDWWVADSPWLADRLNDHVYRQYLRRAHEGPVAVGEEWSEFVTCGCESPQDVRLRVERIDGPASVGPETAVEVVSRAAIEGTDAT
jgi:hypothetical protein